jgi:ABC-2 type transport system ATP-binding protein
MDSIINFIDITKEFGKQRVLDALSMDVAKGEILGIIGKSGCGKSTLLKTLFGFTKLESGKVYYLGRDVTRSLNVVKTRMGFATQDDTFYPKLTVKENMIYYAKLYNLKGKKLKENYEKLIGLFGLKEYEKKYAEDLSGGMKKRLGLAISLIHDPDVFLLDEPTVGLDPMLREEIWDWIRKINALGKTVIVVSHLFDELEKNCHRIAIMNKGKILCIGAVQSYKRLWPNEQLAQVFEGLVQND